VKRVLARLCAIEDPVNKPKAYKQFKAIAATLLDRKQPGNFNQAIMELGALICKPANPACEQCPVQTDCVSYQRDCVAAFPKKEKRKPVPTRRMVAGVIRKKDRLLITRRKPEGLLGGLWEFPGGELHPGEDAAAGCIRTIGEKTGLKVDIDKHLTRVNHAYTHFKILLEVFTCRVRPGSRVRLSGPVDFDWIRPIQLDDFAFPKANLKFMHLIE